MTQPALATYRGSKGGSAGRAAQVSRLIRRNIRPPFRTLCAFVKRVEAMKSSCVYHVFHLKA